MIALIISAVFVWWVDMSWTPEERERTRILVEQIQVEENPVTFFRLVSELNDLLERKESSAERTQAHSA